MNATGIAPPATMSGLVSVNVDTEDAAVVVLATAAAVAGVAGVAGVVGTGDVVEAITAAVELEATEVLANVLLLD